ncbi:MAG: FMN-binding protein [Lachnospira sp.]|nr:FMN-binding protein [Lachnospira sp.]
MNLENVADGVYVGDCNVGYIYAKVRVTVADHKLVKTELLEHRTERGKPAEVILDTMVSQQKTEVDAVSGATNSSKVIMRAVENALRE